MVGLVLIVVHLMLWLLTQDVGTGDMIGWFASLFAFFAAARIAAEQLYRRQSSAIEPGRGTQGAGIGAALIAMFVIWVFISTRNLLGGGDLFANIWAILRLPVDLFLALGLGAWGARLRSFDESDRPFYSE